jgi:hypothetical protein
VLNCYLISVHITENNHPLLTVAISDKNQDYRIPSATKFSEMENNGLINHLCSCQFVWLLIIKLYFFYVSEEQ